MYDYDTFEIYTGCHISSFELDFDDGVKETQVESGYVETAPEDVKGRWIFRLEFDFITPEYYVYLVDFFFAHRGGQFFYFTIPYGMAGLPDEAMFANPGGLEPWDSELEPTAGSGPTYLVRRIQRNFPVKRKFADMGVVESYYETSSAIEFIQA